MPGPNKQQGSDRLYPANIESESAFLSSHEGGKATCVRAGYRPRFFCDANGVAIQTYPRESVYPGDRVTQTSDGRVQREQDVRATDIASISHGLDDRVQPIAWLNTVLEEKTMYLFFTPVDPRLRGLHSNPTSLTSWVTLNCGCRPFESFARRFAEPSEGRGRAKRL